MMDIVFVVAVVVVADGAVVVVADNIAAEAVDDTVAVVFYARPRPYQV